MARFVRTLIKPSTAYDPNSVVAQGYLVFESDTKKLKVPDGTTTLGNLPYFGDDALDYRTNAEIFTDFTTKTNGTPPLVMDTGQVVDHTLNDGTGWAPQITSGKLVAGPLVPASGNYADYYQAQADGDVRAGGARWTVNSVDGSTEAFVCIAAWASFFQGSGTIVPATPAHITFSTTTGAWAWWVSDGGGTGSTHLKAVKTGTFTAPASDGSAVWEAAYYIDPDNGIAYLYLPGVDATTGTRWVTVTDAEISTLLTAQSVPVTTLAATLTGADVFMVEHFCTTAANTARFPKFLDMWGETLRKSRDKARMVRDRAVSVPGPTYKRWHPTSVNTKTTSGSFAFTDVDATNASIICTAGPTGKILLEVDCWYECTAADVVFMRFRGASGFSSTSLSEVALRTDAAFKGRVRFVTERTGLTPNSTGNMILAHMSQNNVSSLKTGINGSSPGDFSTYPPVYIKATPL